MSEYGSEVLYFPQWALADNVNAGFGSRVDYATSFSIHNETSAPIVVTLDLFLSDGSLYQTQEVQLGPRGFQLVTFLPETGLAPTSGWARLSSDARFTATEGIHVVDQAEQLISRVAVLPAEATNQVQVFCIISPEFNTGIAIANPHESEDCEMTVRFRDPATGGILSSHTVTLGPKQHMARYLDQDPFLTGSGPLATMVELEADEPFATMTLFQQGPVLATLPVVVRGLPIRGVYTFGSPNLIGGHEANNIESTATTQVEGATIGGGGSLDEPNHADNHFATVSGGAGNTAIGRYSTVGGGRGNSAFWRATVSGGMNNSASFFHSTVSGGANNVASGDHSAVGGGVGNSAEGDASSVSGGDGNRAENNYGTVGGGKFNRAYAPFSTIAGGESNQSGLGIGNSHATVGGGYGNYAQARYSTVGGGHFNITGGSSPTTGQFATVGGGSFNVASGDASVVPGGSSNEATGDFSFAAGRGAKALHDGTFVWADSSGTEFASSADDQLLIRAAGGVGIGTNSPQGTLDVNGTIYLRGGLLHADYVLEPGYELESIEEHAALMWSQRHLPAVPGAQRDANGLEEIELGSHQRGMLEELEKAHIYIEFLNAGLKRQQERMERLEAELARLRSAISRPDEH